MATNGKKRTTVWIVSILLVVNIAAIATFVIHVFCMRDHGHQKERSCDPDKFLVKELNLDSSQTVVFKALKTEHLSTMGAVARQICDLKMILADEMIKNLPDTLALDSISDEIGDLYGQMRKLNVRHYFNLRQVCRAEQQDDLNTLFKSIFCCDDRFPGSSKGCSKGGCSQQKQKNKCNNPDVGKQY